MLVFLETCGGCPEQYDILYDDKVIGFAHLRYGFFFAEYKGFRCYETNLPKGDGIFDWDERGIFLTEACKSVQKAAGLNQDGLYLIEYSKYE